jgi:hypothetical protein
LVCAKEESANDKSAPRKRVLRGTLKRTCSFDIFM